MAKDSSFDIVSEFDQQEMLNAVDQTCRELNTRYDLKDSGSTVDLDGDTSITITTTDDYSLNSIVEILSTKVVKRGISPTVLERGKVEDAAGSKVREVIKLKKGIDKELGKKIVAEIKATKLKVQPSIQGEQVRVSGKDKDTLQEIIAKVKELGDQWSVPLQFTNYR